MFLIINNMTVINVNYITRYDIEEHYLNQRNTVYGITFDILRNDSLFLLLDWINDIQDEIQQKEELNKFLNFLYGSLKTEGSLFTNVFINTQNGNYYTR